MLLFVLSVALADNPPVVSEMHARYQAVTRIREHLIQGELEPAKALAKDLVDPDPIEGIPPGWKPWVEQLSTASVMLEGATDLPTASMALARVSATCADCHLAHEGGPGLERMRGIPPQVWSAGDNMPLHLWAVDWMWLGLTAPSETAWDRGVTELYSAPLAKMFTSANPDAQRLEAQVYALAKTAATLDEGHRSERTKLMGELLATCAACHQLRDAGQVKAP